MLLEPVHDFSVTKFRPSPISSAGLRWIVPWTFPIRAAFLVLWILRVAEPIFAQHLDSFDQGSARFSLWRDDARTVMRIPDRIEPGVETIEFTHGNGSFVYLITPVEPCAIIPELKAAIRIRSAQAGIRIGMRVVFPRARHPATHSALTEVVFGSPHDGAGRWSTSAISDVWNLVEDRQRFLRRLFGPDIDLREPYVDAILLSVYGFPGTSKIQVDELSIDGMIAPGTLSDEDPAGPAAIAMEPPGERLRRIQQSVPRWIQHQGESLAYLQTLGFNGVISRNPNDPLIAQQSIESGMGVIAPPPSIVPTEDQSERYAHVSAWLLGLALNQSQMDSSLERVAMMSRYPKSLSRPMVAEAWELHGSYSQLSDWLAAPMPLATSVRSAKEASTILKTELRPIAGRNVPMTSLWTQLSNEWLAQRVLASESLGRSPWPIADHDRLQARLQWIRSVMQGSRGWIFRSPFSLDSGDQTASIRAESYASINQEIELFMPWIQAGESDWANVAVNSSEHTAAILQTPSSQLVFVIASGDYDQLCSPAPATERIEVTIPVTGQPRQIYRITRGVLERVPIKNVPGAMVVTIDRPAIVEQLVTMVDNGPWSYLQTALTRLGPSLIESRIDTATQLITLAQMTLVSRQLPASDAGWESIREAQSAQRASLQYLANSELAKAAEYADAATLLAQRTLRSSWEVAKEQFPSVNSSALVVSPLSLPLHFELDRVLQGRRWQPAPLAGTPFVDLSDWKQSGWTSNHRLVEQIDSSIQIASGAGPSGDPAIVLQASSRTGQPIPSGYAGTSMRVTSPKVALPVGSLVHIEALVRVESSPSESQTGLLFSDNMGGEALGQLVSSYDSSQASWRRVSLFRMITLEEGLELYLETRGTVRASVASISLEWIMPTQNRNLPISTSTESTLLVPGASLPGAEASGLDGP